MRHPLFIHNSPHQAKFGMFMHFGPVSQWGTEISFPLVCESFPCDMAGPNKTTVTAHNADELAAHRRAYANLQHTFNPSAFNATLIAELAYAAGMRYVFYTTVHCDGFINWRTQLTDYNIINTPYGKDLYGELAQALRARGIRVGAYVCPSLWNNDNYWAPNATTALGPVCVPNYHPDDQPDVWSRFIGFLHGLVLELTNQYQVDAFWFDCYNSPPDTDTFVDVLLPVIRKNNPEALVMTRNGVFSDYVETDDQSERQADVIIGQEQEIVGQQFEVPAVLQASHQWAYDPTSGQKPASEILANLILLVSKGGNYLVNVAPAPTGLWAPTAVTVLQELAAWFADNAEAIHNSTVVYPAAGFGFYMTSRPGTVYVLIPQSHPDGAGPNALYRALHRFGDSHALVSKLSSGASNITLPYFRPNLLNAPLRSVALLGSGPVNFSFSPKGLVLQYSPPAVPVQLRSYWSEQNNDTAPCATRSDDTCSIYTDAGYKFVADECTCFENQVNDTLPLSLIYNSNIIDNALRNTTWTQPNYADIDVECYAWSQPGPGRVPIDGYWSEGRKDFWMLASDSSRSQAIAAGYKYVVTLGYALPASAAVSSRSQAGPLAVTFKLSFGG